jgi:hypothetical protein
MEEKTAGSTRVRAHLEQVYLNFAQKRLTGLANVWGTVSTISRQILSKNAEHVTEKVGKKIPPLASKNRYSCSSKTGTVQWTLSLQTQPGSVIKQ